jgi:predicted nucleotidyltransferase component of viral defense system
MHSKCLPPQCPKLLNQLRDLFQTHDFILAGGTALSLQLGHRISVDLDFFTETLFSTEKIYREIKKAGLNPIVLQEEKGTLILTINEIKVSFFHYPYPFFDEKKTWKGFSIAGVKDIAAMKVIAITQRGAKRDFIDLYFIFQIIPFWKIAENMVRRFSKERINPVQVGKALVYFADAEIDPDPRYCGDKRATWKNVKNFFVKNLQQMVIDLQRAKEG